MLNVPIFDFISFAIDKEGNLEIVIVTLQEIKSDVQTWFLCTVHIPDDVQQQRLKHVAKMNIIKE
jgi:hypothetical protein